MPSRFYSTLNKQIIRKYWNAPLLEFLMKKFEKKLAYFGLPSPQAEDINDWIDYIDFIVAFQCRHYPFPSDPSQSDKAIRELEFNLNDLMRKKKISDFQLYDGYIEEVIINRKDNDNQKFDLKDFITLYNLDFCNEITVPQEVLNEKTGAFETVYKLHVIKRIIDHQRENNSMPFKFVILLTVKASFWQTEADDYKKQMKVDPVVGGYLDKISSLKGIEKNMRILRPYVFHTLSSILCSNNYIPEFLPVVLYRGTGIHDLVQFTVICTYEDTVGRSAISRQSFNDFLNQSFLTPNSNKNQMEPIISENIHEVLADSNPINLFTTTLVYDEFWK
ncbi:MAG: hypothetical protein NTY95_18415 [Bacteroidia bacterium]|nr:hypothetical protein [Bacteroidia bacterium]